MNLQPEDRSLLIRAALIILCGLLAVLVAGRCAAPVHAAQIAGEIVYTDGDDYPALCVGKELDHFGVPVIARISSDGTITTITVTSCTLIFGGGFE